MNFPSPHFPALFKSNYLSWRQTSNCPIIDTKLAALMLLNNENVYCSYKYPRYLTLKKRMKGGEGFMAWLKWTIITVLQPWASSDSNWHQPSWSCLESPHFSLHIVLPNKIAAQFSVLCFLQTFSINFIVIKVLYILYEGNEPFKCW